MKRKNIFWGIALIAIAVIWIITNLDIFPGVQFGKLAFTLLWAAWLVKGILDRGFFSIFMSIAFLGIVWQHELKIESITPWPVVGSAILLSIGFSLIFGNKERRNWKKACKKGYDEKDGYGNFTSSHAEGENIVHVTKFSGAEKYIDSKNLKSVEIINKFGGCEIYMDKAVPSGNEVYVRVECMCGGVEIYIPKSWKVKNLTTATLGALDETGHYEGDAVNDTVVVLSGTIKLGAVEIVRV